MAGLGSCYTTNVLAEDLIIRHRDRPFCAVIGAGPAGLFAAETLARAGATVTVYEHKANPARKFLMAGRGGLNITHSENLDRFIARYGAAAPFLGPLVRAWPPQALRAFCADLGEATFVGSSGRVFPASFKASPLLRAWLARLTALGVTIATRHAFAGFAGEGLIRLVPPDGGDLLRRVDAVILAMGGASWPRLGSDGRWAAELSAEGVKVTPFAPANCGALIGWSPRFLADFEGQPIKTALISHEGRTARGDLVVTRGGLEGGPVYALSSRLREAVERSGAATLSIDLRPDTVMAALVRKLSRRTPKQSHATFLRKAGFSKVEVALLREASGDGGMPRDPTALATLAKNLPIKVVGVAGLERAISTAGGVALDEVDDRLMLKRLPGVFVAGEMLDFDAPTGGYLLQASFATGLAAGRGAARYLGICATEDQSISPTLWPPLAATGDVENAAPAPRRP